MPFRVAWLLGAIFESLLSPVGIRPPITRPAAGVMGLDNEVDSRLARLELGWESRIPQDQAMERIKSWVETCYRP